MTSKTPAKTSAPATLTCPTCKKPGYKPAAKKSFLATIDGSTIQPVRYQAFLHATAAEDFIKEWDGNHDKKILAGESVRVRVWIIGESEKPQFFNIKGVAIPAHQDYLVSPTK